MLLKLLFLIAVRAHAAVPEIHNEKLFRLDYHGKVSYILATEHSMTVPHDRVMEIADALARSKEVFLETNPDTEVPASPFEIRPEHLGPSPNYLEAQLSSKAVAIVHELAANVNPKKLLSMKPGVVLWFLKMIVSHRRENVWREHLKATNGLQNLFSHEAARFGQIELDLDLLPAASLIFERKINEADLAERFSDFAVELLGKKPSLEPGLDAFVFKAAKELGLAVTSLHEIETQDSEQLLFNSVTVPQLEAAIFTLKARLNDASVASEQMNATINAGLQRELARRFFDFGPKLFGQFISLPVVNRDSFMPPLPGEEVAHDYLINRHKDWVDLLMAKITKGSAFIGVGAAHVIEGFVPNIRKTLLTTFAERGVEITPIVSCGELLKESYRYR